MTTLEAIAAMTPFAAPKPEPITWAAQCGKCGWLSAVTTDPERLPRRCGACGKER